ncbi:MAG: hypothetical protein AB1782_01720 [Cyanobacteriota bacterium]
MLKILDCENKDTTIESLEKITGVARDKIIDFLRLFDIENYYDMYPNYPNTSDVLFQLFKKKFSPSINIDLIYWFHLTRTYEKNKFKEGILPLNEAKEKIWNFLFSLIDDNFEFNEWQSFRENVENHLNNHYADLYRMKMNDSEHWGPFAMLIKDIALRAMEIGNHDYLKIPEIVEDICESFNNIYEINLTDKFSSKTQSCIVKFKSNSFISNTGKVDKYIGVTLYYLYCLLHNQSLNLDCNICFNDNPGIKIPAKNIIKVEYLS